VNDPGSKDDEVTRELLDAIAQRGDVSQRRLAAKLGIALGLTNSYLKRCARKGYVKVKEVPTNRYLYYLTPKGFAEKSRLTARFLSTSLTFYRESAESCGEQFEVCRRHGWQRLVLCGASDLAEIAFMRAGGYPLTVIGVYDPAFADGEFGTLRTWREWAQTEEAHAYLITDLDDPLKAYWDVCGRVESKEQVLVPRVLGLEAAIQNHT